MFIHSFNYWTNILWALVTDRLWRRVVNRVEVALARTELKDGQNWKSLHQNHLEHSESLPAIFCDPVWEAQKTWEWNPSCSHMQTVLLIAPLPWLQSVLLLWLANWALAQIYETIWQIWWPSSAIYVLYICICYI